MTHCDDVIHDFNTPACLRWFLLAHRLPAIDQAVITEAIGMPSLYAKHNGTTVRVTMASRLGDVGITPDLNQSCGYARRVPLSELTDFTEEDA